MASCHSCCRGPVLLKLSWMFRLARRPSKKPSICGCAGLGSGRVNFLHSSFYGAVFCICAGKSVENPGKFSLLLNCLHRVKAFSACLPTPPASMLGGGGGGTKSFFRTEGEGRRARNGEHLKFWHLSSQGELLALPSLFMSEHLFTDGN